MTEQQIKYMANRFLTWRLPDNFRPDGGVTFTAIGNAGSPFEYRNRPFGTNLLDAMQAEEMVRYMIDGIPSV